MDATIIKSLLKCKLSKTELKPIQLVEEDLAKGIIECELSAYAKVIFLKESFEKKRIMETGPWCFDNHLMVMHDWARGLDPVTIAFDKRTFWIQVRGLKPDFFTWEVASKMGDAFPSCEDVELRREKGGSRFFRIKFGVNVLEPLRILIQFQIDDKTAIGYLAYERFPNPCFKCGRMGNLIR
ncbi:hypothetical protein LIER_12243 [Lithospermum erythrorhizon]|uniref:DUF4283 domain-containing protein n=1 Tax=Lithospermum erythrorhizon TaxID=34254 RepID=A0AAV3PTF3_LITER